MARWILRVVRSVKRPTFVKGLIIGSVVALGLFAEVIFKKGDRARRMPIMGTELWR